MSAFPAFDNAETVVLHRRVLTGQDGYGIDIYSDADSAIDGSVFVPGGSVEQTSGQDLVVDRPQVYLPAGTDVTSIDAITARGMRYEVDGTPQDLRWPFGDWAVPVVVQLKGESG